MNRMIDRGQKRDEKYTIQTLQSHFQKIESAFYRKLYHFFCPSDDGAT